MPSLPRSCSNYLVHGFWTGESILSPKYVVMKSTKGKVRVRLSDSGNIFSPICHFLTAPPNYPHLLPRLTL